jgi:hypothetical protein
MTKPTIHLNGTAAADLLAQYNTAYHAVCCALEELCNAAPHGRDYYPQDLFPDGLTFFQAQEEHKERCRKLGSVLAELNELREHVAENMR